MLMTNTSGFLNGERDVLTSTTPMLQLFDGNGNEIKTSVALSEDI